VKEGHDRAQKFISKIEQYFEGSDLVVDRQVKKLYCDIYDLDKMMQSLAKVFREEREDGNEIFFNVSSGSKIQGIVGVLACMMFGGTPYYCVPKEYEYTNKPEEEIEAQTTGMDYTFDVPTYKIYIPESKFIQFLAPIYNLLADKPNAGIAKTDCLKFFYELEPDEKKAEKKTKDGKSSTGPYNKMKSRYLDKLEEEDLIRNVKKPRGKIFLTKEGRKRVEILAPYYGIEIKKVEKQTETD
jgi:predicted transcriptional regulator